MTKGISVYFGEENSKGIKEYIQNAASLGYSKVFTSLHLPEVDFKPFLSDFAEFGKLCEKLNMDLMADISPKTFSYFSYDEFMDYMSESAVNSIRVDFGLDKQTIVRLSNSEKNIRIALNASTILPKSFKELISKGLDLKRIELCHNFYPRPETGISEEFYREQNSFFKSYNLEISAFIPARTGRRAPLFEGLPTLEKHRNLKSSLAFRHLKLLGTDNIYFGDNKISCDELKTISGIREDAAALEYEVFSENPAVLNFFTQTHTDRPDSSELLIRSQESRLSLSDGSFKKILIEPHNTVERKTGDITVDNTLYGRYAGELQICRVPLKAEGRVNVVASVPEDNLFLLPYINRGKKYYFISKLEY